MIEGIFSLIHLALAIWAILNILQASVSTMKKVLWTLFVLLFPLIGLIVWFFIGPKSSTRLT